MKPRLESDPDQPVSAYGLSKLEAERELLKFKNRYRCTIIRPPVVFGPRDRGVFTVIQGINKSFLPTVRPYSRDRQKYYSFVHVDDLCDAIVQAVGSPSGDSGKIYYVCSDEVVPFDEFVSIASQRLKKSPFRFTVPRFALRVGGLLCSAYSRLSGKTLPLTTGQSKRNSSGLLDLLESKNLQRVGLYPSSPSSKGPS